jgi:translocation and assembly module TamB
VDGELRPSSDIPSLRAIHLEALVDAGGIRLQSGRAEVGGSEIRATGNLKRTDAKDPVMDLHLQGENLLLFRNEGMKVRADTDMSVKGPLSRMEISGDMQITEGNLSQRIDILGSLKGSNKPRIDAPAFFSVNTQPFSTALFNIRITSKNPFAIRNNLAKGSVRPELSLSGTGESLALAGEIYVDPTRISLPSGRLNIQSGVIRLLREDPNRPLLNLVGKALILGYDITVLVEGFYDEPKITLSSVPPLPDEELLLLLLTGQPPKDQTGARIGRGQRMKVAVFLGRELISQWTGTDVSEFDDSVLERFEVEIGRAITRSGDETLEAQFRFAEGVIGERDIIYITAEKDVFDAFNAGLRIVFRFK